MQFRRRGERVLCLIVLSIAACTVTQAQKLTTLHSFNGTTDGGQPSAGLTQGADGNFYGTTWTGGGTESQGTVFRLTASGTLTALYNFSQATGVSPYGRLVQASDGNFYGTLAFGGPNNNCQYGCGVIFQITPDGAYSVFYPFAGSDGAAPISGLIQAKDGSLYGTTTGGGDFNHGTVFSITLDGTLTTLHSFCAMEGCPDGAGPRGTLAEGKDGNLYGTTASGGCNGPNCFGTIFKITPPGALTTLHVFNNTDGANPWAALVLAGDGNFYGTTVQGGASGHGTVFKIASGGSFTSLHSFCPQNTCTDGDSPYAPLVQGNNGYFYGTTYYGGSKGAGTIYSITPSGTYNVLLSFDPNAGDGLNPEAGLLQDSAGKLFGVTQGGGAYGGGTVFSFSLGGMQFVPVTPCRVVDTRGPNGTFGGPYLSGNSSRDFPIPQGSCNIPSTALAYSLNATVVPRGSLGYVTVWPTGLPRPLVSTMNSFDGRVKADAVIMPAGTDGAVSIYASDVTDVLLDINGYFTDPGSFSLASRPEVYAYYPVAPCRVVDTRNPDGPLGGPYIKGKTSREFPIQSSSCNLPTGAAAYSMNFTAVPRGPLGFLTVWPSDQQQPYVSTLNAYSGGATANAAIVPAASNGDVSAYVSDDSDLVIDVNGYFAPPGQNGLSLYSLMPCRVLDTRPNAFHGPLMVNVKDSVCSVPTSAQAYVFNATALPQGPLGYLTLWADSLQQPYVSTLNAYDGAVTSNMAIVPTVNGLIDVFASNPTNLLLDITSYFAP